MAFTTSNNVKGENDMRMQILLLSLLITSLPVGFMSCQQPSQSTEPASSGSQPATQPGINLATPQEALASALSFFKSGDYSGLEKMLSRPDAYMTPQIRRGDGRWEVGGMKSFAKFLDKTGHQWTQLDADVAVAAFGPLHKAYRFRFIKRDDRWLLDEFGGGD